MKTYVRNIWKSGDWIGYVGLTILLAFFAVSIVVAIKMDEVKLLNQ